MTQTAVIGYPRIGEKRELKKAVESYLKKELSEKELLETARRLRLKHWNTQKEQGTSFISSNDFSFYDTMLDTALLLNIIPPGYREAGLSDLDTYFALAKGYQDKKTDLKAMEMKKWFNTNYHYLVPEIDDKTVFSLAGDKLFTEYQEALELGIKTKPVLTGPYTLLKLSKIKTAGKSWFSYLDRLLPVYISILDRLNELGVPFLQIDEPALVKDVPAEDKEYFLKIYTTLLAAKKDVKIVLQTYFGDIRDVYKEVTGLGFDGIGLDFVEGKKSLELIKKEGFPENTLLFAGLVNGKNIWRNDFAKTLSIINSLKSVIKEENIILNTSCSLLHVPYSVKFEEKMDGEIKKQLAFAEEKLTELDRLRSLCSEKEYKTNPLFIENQKILEEKKKNPLFYSPEVREKVKKLTDADYSGKVPFEKRIVGQHKSLNLPPLPTTTIGSFPQTVAIRKLRRDYKKGVISETEYTAAIKKEIEEVIRFQEEIGLDVLVHGEFERNDMVEYFGENLAGYAFSQNGWVQSYGTRGVKPPIIYGDVAWEKGITAPWITYAQSLTDKNVKGMLTGPVTMLGWSFPREDISLKEITFQIAGAIKEEVLDLEKKGVKIIQIDEPAIREKLPLREQDWHDEYLEWAIKAFRITHYSCRPDTQIHTHMCYSEFAEIIGSISDLDADVITIESAKSDLSMLTVLKEAGYNKEVGPGSYDIHSRRIPSVEELEKIIRRMTEILGTEKLWVNPDCGLKTRGKAEAEASLKNMVEAAKNIRKRL